MSSRPGQVFSQAFAELPQLRLQDFNYRDIEGAVNDGLLSPLEDKEIGNLIQKLIFEAQGVFLWTDLITKASRKGACSADTMTELQARLHVIPGAIKGLYKDMIHSLDESYLQEACRKHALRAYSM